jgi:hypothetical protein
LALLRFSTVGTDQEYFIHLFDQKAFVAMNAFRKLEPMADGEVFEVLRVNPPPRTGQWAKN